MFFDFALLAQLVEQLPLKEMVGGSIPSRGTKAYLQKKVTKVTFFVFSSIIIVWKNLNPWKVMDN